MAILQGKRAVVFGFDPVSMGIATRFVIEGAAVTVIGDADGLPATGETEGMAIIPLAEATPAAASRAVGEALAGASLDILVLGAGDVPPAPEWQPVSEITVGGLLQDQERETGRALAVCQAAEAALRARGGAVIFLFSQAGLYSEGGWGSRPIVDHARRGLARALAMQWGHDQVRVNTLVPLADTPGYQAYRKRNPELVDFRVSKLALGRLGDPVDDIGGAAVFLACSDSAFLTGSMIFADGGNFLTSPVIETRIEEA